MAPSDLRPVVPAPSAIWGPEPSSAQTGRRSRTTNAAGADRWEGAGLAVRYRTVPRTVSRWAATHTGRNRNRAVRGATSGPRSCADPAYRNLSLAMGPPSPLLAMGKGKPLHPHDPAAQGPRWLLWYIQYVLYLVQYLAEGEPFALPQAQFRSLASPSLRIRRVAWHAA